MAKWKGPRPVAIKLQQAVMFDLFPDSPAVLADFFITDQKHYEALYYPIRSGEITVEDLDRVLGDQEAITELVNKSSSNPHPGIVFGLPGPGMGAGPRNKRLRCNFPVKQVGEITLEQAKRLLSGWNVKENSFEVWMRELSWPLKVMIDYPLEKPIFVEIGPDKQGHLTFGEFLWRIAKEYEKIYENPAEYGVWGHGIEDLIFEAVVTQGDENVYLSVGS